MPGSSISDPGIAEARSSLRREVFLCSPADSCSIAMIIKITVPECKMMQCFVDGEGR